MTVAVALAFEDRLWPTAVVVKTHTPTSTARMLRCMNYSLWKVVLRNYGHCKGVGRNRSVGDTGRGASSRPPNLHADGYGANGQCVLLARAGEHRQRSKGNQSVHLDWSSRLPVRRHPQRTNSESARDRGRLRVIAARVCHEQRRMRRETQTPARTVAGPTAHHGESAAPAIAD